MKSWIKTKIIENGAGKDAEKKPYLSGQDVAFSIIDLGNATCLARIAGTSNQIDKIVSDIEIECVTDDEAELIIKNQSSNSTLENLDILDSEIDELAKVVGLDPELRSDILIPTRGKQVLQDQESYLMIHICQKLDLSQDYWDSEVKKISTKKTWQNGAELNKSLKDGSQNAHEFVLSRIRKVPSTD